jgi:hypothetical protein
MVQYRKCEVTTCTEKPTLLVEVDFGLIGGLPRPYVGDVAYCAPHAKERLETPVYRNARNLP